MPSTDTPQRLRATMCQIRPRKGDVDANLARVRSKIEACAGEADLVVFPETVLSGYCVQGAVDRLARTAPEVARGLGAPPTDAPDVVLGFYERGAGAVYNSALYLTPGDEGWTIVQVHRKVFLPNYGVFEEARFVTPGIELRAFDTRFGRIGLLVCEEMLHSICPTLLALDGAELLVALSATPARGFAPGPGLPKNLERWDVAGRSITLEHGSHLLVAQLVGSEGGKLFAGGSVAYGPGGEILARAPLFAEADVEVALDPVRVRRARLASPLLADLRLMLPHLERGLAAIGRGEDPHTGEGRPSPADGAEGASPPPVDPDDASMLEIDPELLERALVTFLHDEIREKRGFDDVVIGVSGGVDSAVSLFLAARALGPEHVHAFLMPSGSSSPGSLEHGRLLADAAGVSHRTIPIGAPVSAYVDAEEPDLSAGRRGNVMARTRAIVLWDQAARLHALPLGTGNKSERLLGFYTWHADDSPPVNPLGDLFKTQVWALARHLGVPAEVVDKEPSPELIEGVDDATELGVAYPVADRILYWLLEGETPEGLTAAGFPRDAVETVHRRLEGTHWKRALPTVAMISSTAIGEGYLRPVDL